VDLLYASSRGSKTKTVKVHLKKCESKPVYCVWFA
jgi:hypothetical protein